jgi:hypothetical protein
MSADEVSIKALFSAYMHAFERRDANALASFFVYPCQIIAAAEPVSISSLTSAAEYIAIITRFLSLYRKAGVEGGEISSCEVTALAPRVASLRVHWKIHGAERAPLYEFDAVYTVVMVDDAWRIGAIAHNELPQLQALLSKAR